MFSFIDPCWMRLRYHKLTPRNDCKNTNKTHICKCSVRCWTSLIGRMDSFLEWNEPDWPEIKPNLRKSTRFKGKCPEPPPDGHFSTKKTWKIAILRIFYFSTCSKKASFSLRIMKCSDQIRAPQNAQIHKTDAGNPVPRHRFLSLGRRKGQTQCQGTRLQTICYWFRLSETHGFIAPFHDSIAKHNLFQTRWILKNP